MPEGKHRGDDNTGAVSLFAATTASGGIAVTAGKAFGTLMPNVIIGNDITYTGTGAGKLDIKAGRHITVNTGADLASGAGAGPLDIVLNSHYDNDGAVGAINLSGTLSSNGGKIVVGGGTTPQTGYALADAVFNTGYGIACGNCNISAGGGDIVFNGQGATSPSTGMGIGLTNAIINTTGTGRITLNGVGGTGAGNFFHAGLDMVNASISTDSGLLKINGTGGTGSTNALGDLALLFRNANSRIWSNTGPIELNLISQRTDRGVLGTSGGGAFLGWDGAGNIGTGNLSILASTPAGSTMGANGLNLTNVDIRRNAGDLTIGSLGAAGLSGLTIPATRINSAAVFDNVTICDANTGQISIQGDTIVANNGISITGSAYGFTGNNTLKSSTLAFGNTNAITNTGTLTLEQSSASAIGNRIDGTNGNLVKAGAGTLTLTADNTYTGTTRVNSGKLRVGNNGTTGTLGTGAGGTVTIFSGNASTAALDAQVAGASGATRYKTYAVAESATGGTVAGTRNYYYRQKPTLAVTGLTATKVYDGLTDATAVVNAAGASVSGTDGDSLAYGDVTLTGAWFDSKNAGNRTLSASFDAKPFTYASGGATWSVSGYTGATSANAGTGTITPKALTVSGVTALDKIYDGTTAATLNTGGAQLQGLVAGDAVALNTSATAGEFANRNVGNWTVTASGLGLSGVEAGNYTLTQPTGLAANITPKALTVSGVTALDKIYDGTTAATLNAGGAQLQGVVGTDAVALNTSATAGEFANRNVGNWTVTASGLGLSGAEAGNYTLTQPTGLAANITPKALTVSGVTALDKIYDGTPAARLDVGNAMLIGLIDGDSVNLGDAYAATFADVNAGRDKTVTVSELSLGGADAGNYLLETMPTGLTADITLNTAEPYSVAGAIGRHIESTMSGRSDGDDTGNEIMGKAEQDSDRCVAEDGDSVECKSLAMVRVVSSGMRLPAGLSLTGGVATTGTFTLGGSFAGVNTISGPLTGTGGLRSNGAGTWLLNGANTFSGAVTVDAGTLRAGTAAALGSSTAFTVNGGTLDLNGFSNTISTLDGSGGNVALGSGTLTVNMASGSSTYSGIISGSGGLIKRGLGTLTLRGANTYTGATTINNGTLALDFTGAGGPVNNIISSGSALNLGGGTLSVIAANGESNSQSFNGLGILAGNNTLSATSGTGGSVAVNLGSITYTGGVLNFAMPTTGGFTTTNADGALGGWATINGSDYAKVVGGNIVAFTANDYALKDDAGTWITADVVTDTQGAANTPFFGLVNADIQLGGLRYTAAANSTVNVDSDNTLAIGGTIVVAPDVLNSTLRIDGGSITGGAGGTALGIQQNGGVSSNFIIGSNIVDNGGTTSFIKGGTGLVTLQGNNTYTGATTVSQGVLSVSNIGVGGAASGIGASSADSSSLVLQGGELRSTGTGNTTDRGFTLMRNGPVVNSTVNVSNAAANLRFDGEVVSPDNAGLIKTGAGTLTLGNGNNSYGGVTTVSGGTLAVTTLADGGSNSSIGASSSAASNLVLQSGGELEYLGGTVDIDRGFTLGTGGGRVDVAQAGTTLTVEGTVEGAGTLSKNGPGTLVLSGTNTFTQGGYVNSGILRAGSTQAFGPGGWTIASGATLDLNDFNNTFGVVTGAGTVDLGTATLTINGATSGFPFTGSIIGTGDLTVAGGTQVLNGCGSTYTGVTTITGATLSTDCLQNSGVASGIGASNNVTGGMKLRKSTWCELGIEGRVSQRCFLRRLSRQIGQTTQGWKASGWRPMVDSQSRRTPSTSSFPMAGKCIG